MSKYPSTNIVYSGLEDKGGPTVTILDEKKNKWTIWKKDYENKDQDSEAYGSLKNYEIGENLGVEYGEKEESFVNREGKTINFIRRTIFKILPLVAHPTQPLQTVKGGRTEANRGQSGHSNDAYGRRLGVQGHINALLSNPNYYGGGELPSIADLVKEAIAIEDEAEKQLNPSQLRQAVGKYAPNLTVWPARMPDPELPTVQIGEDLGEDIPY